MRRRHRQDDISVGEDSFLDTTANLVGILIILVVVIGTKTKMDADEYSRQLSAPEPSASALQTASEANSIQQALVKQSIQLQEHELESRFRKLERDRLLQLVAMTRETVEERLEETDAEKRQEIDKRQELEGLESKLKDVAEQMGSAEEKERPKIILEHLPTPMAKTVFSREMHIELKEGNITVIPWDRLVSILKEQVPLAARRNSSRSGLHETLGPVGGFMMEYWMNAIPGGFELQRFELETVADAPTESLAKALSTGGRLQLELASRNPAETVITVWVYPDSFATFQQLKNALFQQGFLTAARPLPPGVRIGASPQGTRSSAQ